MFRAAFHNFPSKALRTLLIHVIQNIWQFQFRTSPNKAKLVASLKRMTFQRLDDTSLFIEKITYNMLHVVCCQPLYILHAGEFSNYQVSNALCILTKVSLISSFIELGDYDALETISIIHLRGIKISRNCKYIELFLIQVDLNLKY